MDNLLDLDLNIFSSYAIEAFDAMYGKEYHSMNCKKIENAIKIFYHDVEGLKSYVTYLELCKFHELSIKFLDQIGVDVQKYKKTSYAESLESEVEQIVKYFMNSNCFGLSRSIDWSTSFESFIDTNTIKLKNKIKVINLLLGEEHEQITMENLQSFMKTKEYSELLRKMNSFDIVYEEILAEYNHWKVQLLPYKQYIESEQQRKAEILQKKKNEMFEEILNILPLWIRDTMISKIYKGQQTTTSDHEDMDLDFVTGYFQQKQVEKLSTLDDWMKSIHTLNMELESFRKLVISIPNEEDFLSIGKRKYEEALREYYTTRKDFLDIIEKLGNDPDTVELVYEIVKNGQICVLNNGYIDSNGEFSSVMFFTIRKGDGGYLAFNFLHEIGHIIDQSPEKGSGLENLRDSEANSREDAYGYRRYERTNEILDDIYALGANTFLQKQGIYLFEPKEFTVMDASNRNTPVFSKILLIPLIQKFKEQVTRAKVNVCLEELTKYIGKDNFENLVDIVNRVDYLLRNGRLPGSDQEPGNIDVIAQEYRVQAEQAEQIHKRMDDYYTSNFESSSNGHEKIKKKDE